MIWPTKIWVCVLWVDLWAVLFSAEVGRALYLAASRTCFGGAEETLNDEGSINADSRFL